MKLWWLLALVCLLLPLSAADAQTRDRELLRLIGDNPPIYEIIIDSNEHFSDGRIRDRMYSRIRSTWAAIKGDRRSRLQKETLDRDTLEIKYLYLREGFLNVRITERFERIEANEGARVTVTIHEGTQYLYDTIGISGGYPAHLQDDFRRLADRLKPDRPINYFDVHQAGFDMKTILANNGYPYATVTPRIDSSTARAPITYEVVTDSLVFFGDIEVSGIDQYPAYTATRELRFRKGDLYRRQRIIDSQQRLFESGYFTTLQLQQSLDQASRYHPDFLLQVRERKPYYLTTTTGAGQSKAADLTWSVTGGTGARNLFGSRRIDWFSRIEFTLGSDRRLTDHLHRLRYTEPWFLGIRMPLAFTVEYLPRIRHEAQDFYVQQWNLSLSSTRRFGRYGFANYGVEYQSVDIDGVPDELEEEVRNDVEGLSIRRRIYLSLSRDSRLDVFVPTQGSVRELHAEYYGGFLGGDANFYKIRGSLSQYRTVWPGWVSATRLTAAYAHAFGESDLVPSKDRLFLGGANTIRGFDENSLAPTLSDDLPGANVTFVFNQEFRWKTLQVFSVVPLLNRLFENLPLWQSIFFDAGNGYAHAEDFKFTNLALSYGTGVQIISPAGPIRLDYARRIATENIGFEDRWHFTILYAF